MACEAETDAYTKRYRQPNDPYTAMTEEQIRNIKHVRIEFTAICSAVCLKKLREKQLILIICDMRQSEETWYLPIIKHAHHTWILLPHYLGKCKKFNNIQQQFIFHG